MLDVRRTLKELHRKFPLMSLDELFTILDCYREELNLTSVTYPQITYTDSITTDVRNTIGPCEGSITATKATYDNEQFTGSR